MALADNASTAAARFASLSIQRQLGLMLGLAASVAIGVAVVLWSRDPDYMLLYNQISSRDATEIVDVLQKNNIPYKIEQTQGLILVAGNDLQTAKLKLAAEGLPRGLNSNYEMFSGSNTFNSSQFMETARYKQALENDLARTISQFHDIKAARVHLAIPRESAFVRDSREPSASVFVDVYSGTDLRKHTVAAIVNLVASSIPNLTSSRVTVVNQNGMLLNEGGGNNPFSNTERFQDFQQTMEQQYAQKIQDILTPLLGYGRVKAKVTADMDFTSFEQTQELYNPELAALRSEQKMEENRKISSEAAGVPGALSNKAPEKGELTAQKNMNNAVSNNNEETSNASNFRTQSTRNFELDKTINHTRHQPGALKRLSVAVLVDNPEVMDEKTKKMVSKPLTPEEVAKIKDLVSQAIGLNVKRGDSINIMNSNFAKPDPIAPIPEVHFWQKNGFWSIIKQIAGAGFVLLLVFGLLRPLFKNLSAGRTSESGSDQDENGGLGFNSQTALPSGMGQEDQIALLKQIVNKEPKRVAQVVKTWVDRG